MKYSQLEKGKGEPVFGIGLGRCAWIGSIVDQEVMQETRRESLMTDNRMVERSRSFKGGAPPLETPQRWQPCCTTSQAGIVTNNHVEVQATEVQAMEV